MGCLSSAPTPPSEPSIAIKRKLEELRSLWLPLSIWTGTIKVNGKESPWEIHVKRESKKNEITAKRVVNFAKGEFIDARKLVFDVSWEWMEDENGKMGFKDNITFDYEDDEYRLFCDTLDGILDVKERRICGLVKDNRTENIGKVDFCRVMAKKKCRDEDVVHTVSLDLEVDDLRAKRVNSHLAIANTAVDEEHRRRIGGSRRDSPVNSQAASNQNASNV